MLISALLIKKKLIFSYYQNSFKTKNERIVKKISKTKVATTYAKALLDAALEKKDLNKVVADVGVLNEVLAGDDEFISYMTNPMYSDEDKKSLLSGVLKKVKFSAITSQFLEVLFENRRLGDLALVGSEFLHLYYAYNKIAEVEVESVQKLSATQNKKIVSVLEKKLNQKVIVTNKLNPELLGGLRVRMGSKMFDDTIATKLNNLEIMMKGEE